MNTPSKDFCKGFCRTCGTGCAEYCEEIFRLKVQLEIATHALECCATDDGYAVTPEGRLDVGSANEFKKYKAQEAIGRIK